MSAPEAQTARRTDGSEPIPPVAAGVAGAPGEAAVWKAATPGASVGWTVWMAFSPWEKRASDPARASGAGTRMAGRRNVSGAIRSTPTVAVVHTA
jgi:hypothetical protein